MTKARFREVKAMKIKYGCAFWDWREDAPVVDIVKLARKFKYFFETDLGTDQHNVFFSDHKLTEKLCEELYQVDCATHDPGYEFDEEE